MIWLEMFNKHNENALKLKRNTLTVKAGFHMDQNDFKWKATKRQHII